MKILLSTEEFQKMAADFLRLHPITPGRRVTNIDIPNAYSSRREVMIEFEDEPVEEASIVQITTLVPGQTFGGGFFAGLDMDDKLYAIVVAPKAEGQRDEIDWKDALSFCSSVRAGGFDDWRAPTKDELYMVYRALGPNVTAAEAFKAGQPEAFDERWYWSSTEFGSGFAWLQLFGVGGQVYDGKVNHYRVRAVRKVLI